MANHRREVDTVQLEKLAALGCTLKEMSDFFGVHEQTLTNNFGQWITKGRAELNITLRRWQLELAKKGNVTMQIWLGKNLLKQVDKQPEEISDTIIMTQSDTLNKDEIAQLLIEARREARGKAIRDAKAAIKKNEAALVREAQREEEKKRREEKKKQEIEEGELLIEHEQAEQA